MAQGLLDLRSDLHIAPVAHLSAASPAFTWIAIGFRLASARANMQTNGFYSNGSCSGALTRVLRL